ncbi:hypothetical protein KA050_01425 [Candidatus Gracilibacteria bacterium]|nr:hypothetical protein [Candidatus Gracilibacteria bacterium]
MSNAIMSGEMAIDVYKKMLELQASNHNTAISILLVMAGLLLGATWFWNKQGAKKYIQSEINSQFQKERESMIDVVDQKMREKINTEFSLHEQKMRELEADFYRSMALHSETFKSYGTAVKWWSESLSAWISLDNQYKIRFTVDALKRVLNEVVLTKGVRIPLKNKSQILSRISQIPVILEREKKDIEKKIESLFEEQES